jgi:hypothetical protein
VVVVRSADARGFMVMVRRAGRCFMTTPKRGRREGSVGGFLGLLRADDLLALLLALDQLLLALDQERDEVVGVVVDGADDRARAAGTRASSLCGLTLGSVDCISLSLGFGVCGLLLGGVCRRGIDVKNHLLIIHDDLAWWKRRGER